MILASMELIFGDKKLKKLCEDCVDLEKKLSPEYGFLQAAKIIHRLNELQAAESLYDISKLPQAKLHLLQANLKGCYAVDLKQPYRLIIKPCNGVNSDLKTITIIEIVRITDYH